MNEVVAVITRLIREDESRPRVGWVGRWSRAVWIARGVGANGRVIALRKAPGRGELPGGREPGYVIEQAVVRLRERQDLPLKAEGAVNGDHR